MPKLKKPKLCAIDRQLVSDGWLSPDSYDTNFADVDNTPGIYVFLAIDFNDVSANFVAYVGMSTALKTRWQSHAVLKEIRKNGFWVKRFFKPTDIDDLRSAETAHIQKFNPPWNLIGKTRGVVRS